jgi:hypothetical protein
MNRVTVKPQFAYPPERYDQKYFADVVRAFAQYVEDMANPGEMRGTTITLTDLPTSASGLEVGSLIQQAGVIYIVQANVPMPDSLSASSSLGSVTVATS